MLRLLIDQDFDHDILRGLRLRVPDLNAVTAREADLGRKSDPEVLAWRQRKGGSLSPMTATL